VPVPSLYPPLRIAIMMSNRFHTLLQSGDATSFGGKAPKSDFILVKSQGFFVKDFKRKYLSEFHFYNNFFK
jgi:hypothetical protein